MQVLLHVYMCLSAWCLSFDLHVQNVIISVCLPYLRSCELAYLIIEHFQWLMP